MNPELPIVVLLPGMDGTGHLFQPLCDALHALGVRTLVISYDVGDPCDYETTVPAILSKLPPKEDLVVLGESYSGPMAILLAAAAPERIKGLVLCATFARYPLPQALRVVAGLVLRLPLPMTLPNMAIRGLMLGWDTPGSLVAMIRDAMASVPGKTMRARARNTMAVDQTSTLRGIAVPTLYLRAGNDRLVPGRAAKEVVRNGPDVRVVDLDAPHLLLQRCPTEAANSLLEFLNDLNNGGARSSAPSPG